MEIFLLIGQDPLNMYKMKTSPAMSDCPIKSGVILEKGVCDDRALQRKPIKSCSRQDFFLAPALQPAATVQDSQDNLLQLLCCCRQRGCKHWFHFLCFNVLCVGIRIRIPEHRQESGGNTSPDRGGQLVSCTCYTTTKRLEISIYPSLSL